MLTTLHKVSEASAKKNQSLRAGPKRLKIVEVFVYTSVVSALFDSGAVPNVMCAKLCSELHLETRVTDRKMRTADGLEACVLGEVHELPITVGNMT